MAPVRSKSASWAHRILSVLPPLAPRNCCRKRVVMTVRLFYPLVCSLASSHKWWLVRQQQHTHSQDKPSFRRKLKLMLKWKNKDSRLFGEIILCLSSIGDQSRAGIEVAAAEQRVTHIQTLAERSERREETIGTVIEVADKIIGIIENVAQVSSFAHVDELPWYLLPPRSILYSMCRGRPPRLCTRRVAQAVTVMSASPTHIDFTVGHSSA